jgi:peptidoglycan/xylan/chitin deacetylase (PgdA/CDA1 family)
MTAIPILLYHSISSDPASWIRRFAVSPDAFESHLDLLIDRGATTLTVSALADAMAQDPVELPARTVLITFDDGFADFHEYALPALVDRGLASTLYVTTGFLGGRTGGGDASGERMLDWSQLAEVSAAGVEIGGHSHSHPQLDMLRSRRAADEVTRCKSRLEQELGVEVRSFAYPHGYFGPRVQRLVVEAGYSSACAVKNAFSSTVDDIFSLARLTVETATPPAQIAAWLAGEGAPAAWANERLRTRAWRLYRRSRVTLGLRSPVELPP